MHRLIFVFVAGLAGARPAGAQPTTPITLKFAATAAGAPVTCASKIDGVGTTKSTISLIDFRFYSTMWRSSTSKTEQEAV